METKWLIYYLPTIIASEKTDEIDLLIIEILLHMASLEKELRKKIEKETKFLFML